MYKCKCGKEFDKKQSYVAHCGHCRINLGYEPDDRFGDSRAWSKGKTKDDPIYGDSIKKISDATISRNKVNNPLVNWNKNKPDKSLINQSETRKKKYLSGELIPAAGTGRGKYSYIKYDNKEIMLRSTYEFIYALYLLYNGVRFEYESVKVKSVTDKYKSFISDFLIDNDIIEIKGYKSSKIFHAKKAFEHAGYRYKVITWTELSVCYNYLKSVVDIDDLLMKVISGHNSKNYFHYEFMQVSYNG